MIRIAVLSLVMMMSSAAMAQDVPVAGVIDFTRCAAMAEATSIQYRNVIKNDLGAKETHAVANAYAIAAMFVTDKSVTDPKAYVSKLVEEQIPTYLNKLTTPEASVAELFPADSLHCGQIEPQASKILEALKAKQAN